MTDYSSYTLVPWNSVKLNIKNVKINKGVTSIGDRVFFLCRKLVTVTIPDGITTIGHNAFRNCESLTSVTIPDSVTYIGVGAFAVCISLTAINVSSSNKVYTSVGGVLYNKSKTEIIHYPAEKTSTSYKILDSVTSIRDNAFFRCENLISIKIPDSVTRIGYDAFYGTGYYNNSNNWEDDVLYIGNYLIATKAEITGNYVVKDNTKCIAGFVFRYCQKLTSITIPDSVKNIGEEAFDYCDSLNDVYYSGTDEGWSLILIENSNTCLTNARRHYNVFADEVSTHYDVSVTTKPTCTTNGMGIYECSCGYYFEGEIGSWGHNYSSSWTIDVPSTCQSEGSKSHHCTRCDDKRDVTVVKPVPHQFSEWEILKDATYTSYGQKVSICDVCHSTEYAVIPKLVCSAPKLKRVTNTANGVKITWSKVTGAESYVVLRKTGNGKWKKIAEKITVTSYTDKTAKSGKTYKYTVRASSQGGLSKYNATGLSIKHLADPVLKTPASTKSGITLKWSKVTGANGYIVYRKTGNGSYAKLATVKGVSKVSYVDKSAKKGKKYTYKVKAYYGKTYSAYSNAKTIKDKY